MATVLEPLAPGDPAQVGGYELRARLGAGGMGRVYLGFSPAGRAVAVKVVHPALAHDREFRARFRRETDAARAVSGAFTAPVVGAGPDDDPPWLAISFVPGPSLADAVATGGPLSAASTWRLAAGLVEALEAIHAAGLVHRDLKPANVLLAADGPRVIDFGISRALEGTTVTVTGITVGTPAFMSPEQARGEPPETASDVFSLGCLLTFAVTGVPPFGDGSPAAVLYRVVHTEPSLDGVTGPLRDLAAACLAKTPASRPSLQQLAATLTGSTPPDAAPPLASFWPQELASLIASYQAPLSAPPFAGPDPGGTRPDAAYAATRTVVPPSASPPAGGPSAPPPSSVPGLRAGPLTGVTRRRVLVGASGALAAGAGISAWALTSGRGRGTGGKAAGTHTTTTAPNRPAAPGTKLWSFTSSGGQVYSVAAGNGRVYLANSNINAAPDAHDVYGLDAADGHQLWRVTNLGELYSPITVYAGFLFFGTDFHGVYMMWGQNGSVYWKYDTGAGVISQPALALGRLWAGSANRNLYMLEPANKKKVWNYRAGGAVRSGPVLSGSLTGGDALVTFGSDDGTVYQLGAANGQFFRRYTTGGAVATSPAVAPGLVYAASDDNHVYCWRADTGAVRWRFATPDRPYSPVLAGDILYVGCRNNTLYALSASAGTKIWTFPAAGDAISWRVTVTGGVVYAGGMDGHLYALNAADGTKRWSYRTGGPVNSAPQIANGVVYIGSDDGSVYALHT